MIYDKIIRSSYIVERLPAPQVRQLPQVKLFFILLLIMPGLLLSTIPLVESASAQTTNNNNGNNSNNSNNSAGQIRYDPNDPDYYANLTKFSYILYYGGFTDEVARAILSAKPTLLVTNYYAMDSKTRLEFAENNVSTIAYVPIKWTQRDLGSAISEINQLLDDGADGIFIDEASTVGNEWELWYHYQIYETVKDEDEENIVVINPGTTSLSEDAMLVADIICFEHEWRSIKNVEWMSKYPGWRYMAISSNEFTNVMGYHVDAKSAKQDLEEARSLNIAYQYSADHYIWLPPWLDVYGGIAGSPHPVSAYVPLDLDALERPSDYYPVVNTTTDKVGNDHDVVIIDEEPDDTESNEEEHDSSGPNDNDETSPSPGPDEGEEQQPDEGEEQQPDEEGTDKVAVDPKDDIANSNSTTSESNASENSTSETLPSHAEQQGNTTITSYNQTGAEIPRESKEQDGSEDE